MSTVRLKDVVRLPDGSLSTLAVLADAGRIEFRKVTNFAGKGVTKYFADLKEQDNDKDGNHSGWEIGELAYLSRTGQRNEIQARLA